MIVQPVKIPPSSYNNKQKTSFYLAEARAFEEEGNLMNSFINMSYAVTYTPEDLEIQKIYLRIGQSLITSNILTVSDNEIVAALNQATERKINRLEEELN